MDRRRFLLTSLAGAVAAPLLAEAQQAGKHTIGAKDDASLYVGGVTRSWLKVKVPGWTDPEDRWKRVLTVS
jgi:hypothetical protein